jgi:hypothetical protein
VSVVALDDLPGVLLQLRRLQNLEQSLGHPLDQLRLRLGRQPALEQLDADEGINWPRDGRRRPAEDESILIGNVSSRTGASASMKVTPSRVNLVVLPAVDDDVTGPSVFVSPRSSSRSRRRG